MSTSASIYPFKPWLSSADISNSNFLRGTYVNGNLDISGQLISRTDASFSGNLAISGSFSTNNSVSVSNNIGMSGIINQMSAVPLSGGFVYTTIVVNPPNVDTLITQVQSLNTLLITGTSANYGTNVTLGSSTTNTVLAGPINYVTGSIVGLSNANINGNLIIGGNTLLSGTLTTTSDTTINNTIFGSGKSSVSTNTLVGGGGALQNTNSSSSQNTAIGYGALNSIASSGTNTAIGYYAGSINTSTNATSSNMTFLGANTGTTTLATPFSNSTAIGVGALISGSNQIVLGRNTEKTIVSGDASLNGNVSIQSKMMVSGDASLNGNLSIQSKMMVSGDASLNGNVSIQGTMLTSNIKQFFS